MDTKDEKVVKFLQLLIEGKQKVRNEHETEIFYEGVEKYGQEWG